VDAEAEEWVRGIVTPTGPAEDVHVRPWARASRLPVADGAVWFKACGPVQAFEPRLTSSLHDRHPGLLADVLGHDQDRGWLLLADAGRRVAELGNPPEAWLRALPAYAELQRAEASFVDDHVAHGVPDLRTARIPGLYDQLLGRPLPLAPEEVAALARHAGDLARWCDELASSGVPDTVQHGDLHMYNLFVDGDDVRVIDWGDSSVGQPFASLLETFRFLEELNGLSPDDPWFGRLRDAYLEGWDAHARSCLPLALTVGAVAHCLAWLRQRDHLSGQDRLEFDEGFAIVLRRALDAMTATAG
jgi:hypothetical protein